MTARRRPRVLLTLVLLLAALLAGCGGGPGDRAKPSTAGALTADGPPQAQTVKVVGNAKKQFAPGTVRARTGTLAITLTIEGGVPHDLVFDDPSVGAAIPVTTGSSTRTYTFSRPGTYRFVCTLHPGMVGQVLVS